MQTIRWLHLSDLHFNTSDERIAQMRSRLIDYISAMNVTFDCIFCTGDFREGGKPYLDSSVNFLHCLCEAAAVPVDHLYIVPGNHDVKRDEPSRAAAIETIPEDWDESFSTEQLSALHKGKEEFLEFLAKVYAHDRERLALYQDAQHPHFLLTTDSLNILHLDSALTYGKDRERELYVDSCLVETVLEKADPTKPILILSHYSFDFLAQYEKKTLVEIMRKYNARLWLAGHEHDYESQIKRDTFYEFLTGTLKVESKSTTCFFAGELTLDLEQGTVQCHAWNASGGWEKKAYFTHTGDDPTTYFFDLDPHQIERSADTSTLTDITVPLLMPNRFFVHREQELQIIREYLQTDGKCAIIGMGGIGKTALARKIASVFLAEEKKAYFIPCHISVAHGMATGLTIPRVSRRKISGKWETDEEYALRLFALLRRAPDLADVLVFDNIDPNDPMIDAVLSMCHQCIITTRFRSTSWGLHYISLSAMPKEHQKALFEKYLERELYEEEIPIFERISQIVSGHTLMLQLIARQCVASDHTLEEILSALEQDGVYSEDPTVFTYDEHQEEKNMYGHIRALWNLVALSPEENHVLQGLSLLPSEGLTRNEYREWMDLGSLNDVNRLIYRGWIQFVQESGARGKIALHPVLSEIIYRELYLKNSASLDPLMVSLCGGMQNRALRVQLRMRNLAFGEYLFSRVLPSETAVCFGLGLSMEEEYQRELEKAKAQLDRVSCFIDALGLRGSILEGHMYNNYAVISQTAGDYSKALAEFSSASQIYRFCGYDGLVCYAYALHNIARVHYGMRNFQKALEIEDQAEPIFQEIKREYLGEVYDLRAACYAEEHQLASERALEDEETMGQLFDTVLKYSIAAIELKQTYTPKDQQGIIRSKQRYATRLAIKDPKTALQIIQEALQFYEETTGKESGQVGVVYCDMGTIFEKLGDMPAAIRCGQRAVELIEKTFGTNCPEYRAAVHNLNFAYSQIQQ